MIVKVTSKPASGGPFEYGIDDRNIGLIKPDFASKGRDSVITLMNGINVTIFGVTSTEIITQIRRQQSVRKGSTT